MVFYYGSLRRLINTPSILQLLRINGSGQWPSWLITPQRRENQVCVPPNGLPQTNKNKKTKQNNPESVKLLDRIRNLQEIQGTEGHVNQYHRRQLAESRVWEIWQDPVSSTKNYKENKIEETAIDETRRQNIASNHNVGIW